MIILSNTFDVMLSWAKTTESNWMVVEVKVMGNMDAGGAAFLNHSFWVSEGASQVVGIRRWGHITAQQQTPVNMC